MKRLLLAAFSAALLLAACGDDSTAGICSSDRDCDGLSCVDGRCVAPPDGSVDRGVDGPARVDASMDVAPDAACAEDCGEGDCIGGTCCEAAKSCAGVCCGSEEVCSFNACVTPGDACLGEEDCRAGEYCEPSLGETVNLCGETPTTDGRCLPSPPACPAGVVPDPASPECIAECRFTLPSAELEVQLAYSWGNFDGDRAEPNLDDIRNSPIVVNLDDDDCDGRITARDTPEIVVIVSPRDSTRPVEDQAIGDLVVLAVEDGELREKWRVPGSSAPWTYPAAGDFHPREGVEIVTCDVLRRSMRAWGVSEDGESLVELWSTPLSFRGRNCTMPSILDADGDGDSEILVLQGLIDGATGTFEAEFPEELRPDGYGFAADVDNDPMNDLELVFADDVFTYRGGTLARLAEGPVGFDHALVAQLDGAGPPEIVSVDFNTHLMDIWRVNPAGGTEFVRRGLDINGTLDPVRCAESSAGRERGGGPPTAGDVNGDGVPDIAIAGGVGYAVLNGASLVDMAVSDADTFLWQNETVDCSSAQTGSSVFDFNGDGRVEVLYADEQTFRIYNGENGDVIFQACNTNGTILEQPIVADVDADGQADAIVVSNARYRNCIEGTPLPDGSPGTATDATSGVRIYSSVGGDWVRTRRVWNQHAYSITNVREDGTIPSRVDPNWQTLNNFRLNRQPGNEDAAADVVVQLLPNCAEGALEIVVRNVGESVLPAGVSIDVYRGPGMTPTEAMRLETLTTTTPLFPAQSQAFSLPLGDDRDVIDLRESAAFAIATVPEGTPECRAENNVSVLARFCDLL